MGVRGQRIQNGWAAILILFLVAAYACGHEARERAAGGEKEAPATQLNAFEDYFSRIENIVLTCPQGTSLSDTPFIGGTDSTGDLIILDKVFKRQILVFNPAGEINARIGSEGRGPGQYLYPECVYFQPDLESFYVYDSDLMKIIIFDRDGRFIREFGLSLFFERLAVTPDGRIFCYTSGTATLKGIDRIIYEVKETGEVLNRFGRMPENFTYPAESKGGGLLIIKGFLYTVTPYKYQVQKFDLKGRLVDSVHNRSARFTPPPRLTKREVDRLKGDFQRRRNFHKSFSHISRILQLDDLHIGVLYRPKDESDAAVLDIYDLDLNLMVGDIDFPLGPNRCLLVHAERGSLFMFTGLKPFGDAVTAPIISRFRFLSERIRYP